MDLVEYQMQSIHGLAIHSPESNKSSRWSLMDLVHMATCPIRWAILWSTESVKIRQNQEKDFGGFGVVRAIQKTKTITCSGLAEIFMSTTTNFLTTINLCYFCL